MTRTRAYVQLTRARFSATSRLMKKYLILIGALLTLGVSSAQAGDCLAQTFCPNRNVYIFCETWGYSCTWYVQPYQYVQCTGFDLYGQWVNVVQSCL